MQSYQIVNVILQYSTEHGLNFAIITTSPIDYQG